MERNTLHQLLQIAVTTFIGVVAGILTSPFGVPAIALFIAPDLYLSLPNPSMGTDSGNWIEDFTALASNQASRKLLLIWIIVVAAACALTAILFATQKPSRDVQNGILGNARIISSDKELKKRNDFWDGKGTPDKAGLVLGSSRKGYYFDSTIPHAAIFGRTGSGKSVLVCLQTLHLILARGWSCFITGKNELYELTSDKAREIGYDVAFFSLSGYPGSMHFNPLELIVEYVENGDIDKAQQSARFIAEDIIPKNGTAESYFTDSARSALTACMLIVAFADIDRSEKNMASVCSLINLGTSGDGKDPSAALKSYIRSDAVGRNHPAYGPASDFLSDGGITTAGKNVLSTLKQALAMFNDEGIRTMTSRSDISIRDIVRNKTAIYMGLLEENNPYLILATIFLNSYWRVAQEEASANGGKLPHETAIIGDEWGNLPRVACLPEIATLGRSMKIHAYCFTQDVKQWNKYNAPLDQNAGRDKILGCMGCKVALSLSNPDDCEWFAKICGKRTVRTQGLSSQKRGSRFATGDTESYTEHADDLVHPWELATRNPIRDGILVSKSAENPSPGREGVFQFKVDYANNTPAGHFFGLGTEKECDAKRVAFYQRELRRHVNVIEDTVPCWAPDFNFQSGQTADIKADEWSAWEDR